MKKIKIFIASSAELNEDKQMFDLYFSDKNKLIVIGISTSTSVRGWTSAVR